MKTKKKNWILTVAILFSSIAIITSCVKKPDSEEKEKDEDEIVNVDDLRFDSFVITTKNNNGIYGDVRFSSKDKVSYLGKIEHYKTSLDNLIVTFETNASKVMVGSTVQESGVTPNNFSNPITYKIFNKKNESKEIIVQLTNNNYSGDPVLVIYTNEGVPVTSKEDWVAATISLDKQNSLSSNYSNFKIVGEIKGRGHNTWAQTKKPYNIKLESGAQVLGMKKNKRWVLLANASDRTLMRNNVAFEIGKKTSLQWTPDSRYIEVVLNGRFLGSYLVTEQIRVDENRVNITPSSMDNTSGEGVTGGFLFEIDRYYDEGERFKSTIAQLPIMFKDDVNKEQVEYAKKYFNDIENLLYNGTADNTDYKKYIDVDTFADWWIIHELTRNTEPRLPGSCYMYKDKSGIMMAGPIWDFDLTTFKESSSFHLMESALWYEKLFLHNDFKQRVKERWIELKPKFETIPTFIDTQKEQLKNAAKRNWDMWSIDANQNGDTALSWEDAVERLKTNYSNRLAWMDEQISKW